MAHSSVAFVASPQAHPAPALPAAGLRPAAHHGSSGNAARAGQAPNTSTASLGAAAFVAGAAALQRRAAQRRRARGVRGGKTGRNVWNLLFGGEDDEGQPTKVSQFPQIQNLTELGKSPKKKALAVNLDPDFYGSFAEIGAGQEVSRTFLTAGAAAGTVARSISAYDMKVSDQSYGKSSRYVTKERLLQMLDVEYQICEENLRENKGKECKFFSFASTVAARAFMSDRECEGWIGLQYQAEAGQETSTIAVHIRLADPTAQQQAGAIGVLGTNLIYLAWALKDPYLITTFLLDGLSANDAVDKGRIEVDVIEFSGPAFPEGSVDPRLLALRMVQARIANAVLLEPAEEGSPFKYRQACPNSHFYKRPVIMERSRFMPVTNMHLSVIKSCARKLEQTATEGARDPVKMLTIQVDDITCPVTHMQNRKRLMRLKEVAEENRGKQAVNWAEFQKLVGDRLSQEEKQRLFKDLQGDAQSGKVSLDALLSIIGDEANILNQVFLERFAMMEPLGYDVLVSSVGLTHKLALWLSRYTKEEISVAVGGGEFSIERALFRPEVYSATPGGGGMLEALGRLFSKNVKVLIYPNIDSKGTVTRASMEGNEAQLYEYLVTKGNIVPLTTEEMSTTVREEESNKVYRYGSEDVKKLIAAGDSSWEEYVPPGVADIAKTQKWYSRLTRGVPYSKDVFKLLNEL